MKRFKKILVGVDLSWGDCCVAEELSAPNAEAVRQAMWMAKLNSASVNFLYSLDLSEKAQQLISTSATDESTILNKAEQRLNELAAQAREENVAADSQVLIGKGWRELIRQVRRAQHDLVIVGTRHLGAVRGFLLGSTGIKLLRKCPCPVLVVQPQGGMKSRSILVAHDLRPVGDLAMELGCSMAKLQNARLHVVHAAEYAEFDYLDPPLISAERKEAYRQQAENHIQTQLAAADLSQPAQLHVVDEPLDVAITNRIEPLNIGLVVMGTVVRTGISGLFMGNAAERLLPRIPCSLLAVKPSDSESPFKAPQSYSAAATSFL